MGGDPRARSEGIVVEEAGDELVVYVENTQMAHALSKDAALVWRRCDGLSSANDIARSLGLEQARVGQALDELSAAELIEEPDGISRRALYKRAAKLGAAALSAPLIYSVAIRPPNAAASPPSTCGTFFGQACELGWLNDSCSGTPAADACQGFLGAPAGCTCHVTSGCLPGIPGSSRKDGTCR